VYSGGHLVMSLDHFKDGIRAKGDIGILSRDHLFFFLGIAHISTEVAMIPMWDVDSFAKENLKTHTWRHIPAAEDVTETDPLVRATRLFNLINPSPGSHWEEYIKHRLNSEKITQSMLDDMAGEDMHPYMSELKDAVIDSLDSLDSEHEQEVVADCVSVLSAEASDDGWGNVRILFFLNSCTSSDSCLIQAPDVEVLSRIHSPNSTSSVDIHFFFHHRTRMYSVECLYAIGFRINDAPTQPSARCPTGDVKKMHSKNGWTPFGWFYLDNRRAEHSRCSITTASLTKVHDALFGAPSTPLGGSISLPTTACLMLAAAGIRFNIAEDDEEEDGYTRPYGSDMMLELASEKPGISAAHLRKICGIAALDGDGMYNLHYSTVERITAEFSENTDNSDLSKEQVTTPMD